MSEYRATGVLPLSYFVTWLARGERGLSSEAMVSVFTGGQVNRYETYLHYPLDPDDFRRCERLLRAYPITRPLLPMMKTASPVWSRLVDEWDVLVALIESEAPGIFDGAADYRRGQRAPLGYARMRDLIDNADEKEEDR